MTELPPFALFYLAALLAAVLPQRACQVLMLAVPVAGGLALTGLTEGTLLQWDVAGLVLEPLRVDALSLLFGYLFHIAAFLGVVFSLHVTDRTQHVAALLYAGSALGAVFAGDLLTLFLFWEMLALSSVFLIFARGSGRAYRAGMRYLVIQVLSGVLLLAGALMLYRASGSLVFGHIGLTGFASVLIFIAFGIKCAFPLLHNWLTDAYPEATATGTVFLSAFTTKVAVYALARGFAGTEALVYIGTVMTCFPIFFAVIENDLRRVLAYSMINQIGFMVVGIGLGTALAMNGAVAHAFNDVIFKGLLMMSMGAVLHMTGRINGSDLGGLYKSMPITTTLCIVGAASISAFPLFSGFVSKSMVMVATLEEGHPLVWLALLFASAGVFHHAGIKIPFFAFFAHDAGIRTTEPPLNMLTAMSIAAILCVFIGSYPWLLYDLLPFTVNYAPFDGSHVLAQIQLLVFSAAAFAWLKVSGLYPPELHSTNIDVEWLYRRLAPRIVRNATSSLRRAADTFGGGVHAGGKTLMRSLLRHYGPEGTLARTWPTGSMVLWVAVLLAASLILYYL
ncbi:MAG TPA: Na(+)/H(+) antiporter subunit D [Gammaproteobacteria bacterium]|jgi:multicomponent Na+:H+ antiporter subunit D|nr:Na(+)/H(+) antiporter subunit D [Arenicellales bacterium]HCY13470.1 Na(+)/H(+) antiporter subunit D [Gammaproteobacteria bacterium]|tara:strand:+ start:5396 stop:7084 length:1689 start_codon:yes stop_codon:yes gene_type:complete